MSSPRSPVVTPSSCDETLPDGWVQCESKSVPGRKYYFDRRSGSSLWTKPPLTTDKTPKSKQRKTYKEQPSPTKTSHYDEDAQKHTCKRKIDCSDHGSSSVKRTRQESSGSETYSYADTPTSSNVKHHSRSQGPYSKDVASKHGSGKNLASKRMEKLRSQIQKEEDRTESPSPHCSSASNTHTGTPKSHSYETNWRSQDFVSPKTDSSGHKISPIDRADRSAQGKDQRASNNFQSKAYIPKNSIRDALSPNSSDAAASSQANETLEMVPSPSQFFEVNKMICTLQSQLVEERVRGVEDAEQGQRKGTFASIEEGINNPNVVYASEHHPATPPHFSKTSQIVSSIKSRLNDNISECEKKSRFSTPANDRLTALRTTLNHSVAACGDKSQYQSHSAEQKPVLFENSNLNKQYVDVHPPLPQRQLYHNRQLSNESMEVDQYQETRERRNTTNKYSPSPTTSDQHVLDNLVLVVDTNIFIHDIQFVKLVMDSYITGYKTKPILVVPWQVVNELDRLKDNNNGNKKTCSKAKIATDYLYQVLPNSTRIKGQTLRDADDQIYTCQLPDDEILNCCLQQSRRGNAVILLSNDKNLCNRATINSIRAMGVKELKDLVKSETEISKGNDLHDHFKYYEASIYRLLANILENEMRAKYDAIWHNILFKTPPWSLLDVLQCLNKHWVAVFSEVFPRIEPLIHHLKAVLTRIYDKETVPGSRITSSDVVSFKDAAYELASKCQIIPDYMELAKVTMQRLSRGAGCDKNVSSPCAAPVDEDKIPVDALESIWVEFSSYCAKLATMLGVNHQLIDLRENNESPDSLTDKWPEYSRHIQSMAYALKRTLTANENSGIEPLHTELSDCLRLIGRDSNSIDNDSLRTFCLNNRNMIHEALVKFTQLTELLTHCRSAFGN